MVTGMENDTGATNKALFHLFDAGINESTGTDIDVTYYKDSRTNGALRTQRQRGRKKKTAGKTKRSKEGEKRDGRMEKEEEEEGLRNDSTTTQRSESDRCRAELSHCRK
ncbi:hypothetical protein EYF80_017986 [Liparis tanakae]|uniref:Uncharacterized protein n=1 Tax=Liparis tanakae TaxID=230148 RepID=A0A4Z2I2W3_9TELE|nr:hypothetical protein EYF80_017986 [Liparis tanakae]